MRPIGGGGIFLLLCVFLNFSIWTSNAKWFFPSPGGLHSHAAKSRFVVNPTSEEKLIEVLKYEFLDLLNATDETEIRNARDNISVTGIAFLLSKLANKDTEWFLKTKIMHARVMKIQLYSNKVLFCKLLKLWQAHRENDFNKMNCSQLNESEIENVITENEPLMQEINFGIYMTIFYIKKEDNKEFIDQFMVKAKMEDEAINNDLEKKFRYVFGLPRFLLLKDLHPERFGLLNKTKSYDKMLAECFLGYFNESEKNIVTKWRYILVLNSFVYREWWTKFKKNFKEFPPELSKKMNFIFDEKAYWNGEDVIRNQVGETLLTDRKYVEKKLEDIFDKPEGFTTHELSVPSFFESTRRSTEELYANAKPETNKEATENLEEQDKYWTRCNEFNMEEIGGKKGRRYRNLQENLNGQKIMRTRKLMALLRDEEKFWKEANKNMDGLMEKINSEFLEVKKIQESKSLQQKNQEDLAIKKNEGGQASFSSSSSKSHMKSPTNIHEIEKPNAQSALFKAETIEKAKLENLVEKDAQQEKKNEIVEREGNGKGKVNDDGENVQKTDKKSILGKEEINSAHPAKVAITGNLLKLQQSKRAERFKLEKEKFDKAAEEKRQIKPELTKAEPKNKEEKLLGVEKSDNKEEVGKKEQKPEGMVPIPRKGTRDIEEDLSSKRREEMEGNAQNSQGKFDFGKLIEIKPSKTNKTTEEQPGKKNANMKGKKAGPANELAKEITQMLYYPSKHDEADKLARNNIRAAQNSKSEQSQKEGQDGKGGEGEESIDRVEEEKSQINDEKDKLEKMEAERKGKAKVGVDEADEIMDGREKKFRKLVEIKNLYGMANENAAKNHSFDGMLSELYAFYFEERDVRRLKILENFIYQAILVEIIEGKFEAAEWLLKKGGIFGVKEMKWIEAQKTKWKELLNKQHSSEVHPVDVGMEKRESLLKEIFNQFECMHSLPAECFKDTSNSILSDEWFDLHMQETLHGLHFQTISMLIGRHATIMENDKILLKNFEEFKGIVGRHGQIRLEFYLKLQPLLNKDCNRGKFNARIIQSNALAKHIDFEIKLHKAFEKMEKRENSELMPETWLNPQWFEFSQPEYSLHYKRSENEEKLSKYLEEAYRMSSKEDYYYSFGRKEYIKQWLREQIRTWLKEKYGEDVFALYVGGSELFEADDKDTDLDMTIILPNIVAESLKCGYCKLKRRLCQKHNVIFSDIEGSFYLHLNNAIKQDKELDNYNLTSNGAFVTLLPEAYVPLLRLSIVGIQVDMTFVILPFDSPSILGIINENVDFANYAHSDELAIDNNLNLIKYLFGSLLINNANDVDSIRALSSFLASYRLKFQLIKPKQREIFKNLLRAVKLWAKRQHIYSNVLGYLSGTSLAIMAGKICLLYPTGNLEFLLEKFFFIYSTWEWPRPVLLEPLIHMNMSAVQLENLPSWLPKNIDEDKDGKMERMPIIMAQFPETNTAFNVNEMSRRVIQKAMQKAVKLFKIENPSLSSDATDLWKNHELFWELNYETDFDHYFLLRCTSTGHQLHLETNCDRMKGKIRWALEKWAKNEKIDGIFVGDHPVHKYAIKDHLELYHVFSGFERKGLCQFVDDNGTENPVKCLVWLVGVKFKEEGQIFPEMREKFMKALKNSHFEEKEELKTWLSKDLAINYCMKKEELANEISSMFTEEFPNDETFKPENMAKFRERHINKATKILEGYTPLSRYAEEFKPDYTKLVHSLEELARRQQQQHAILSPNMMPAPIGVMPYYLLPIFQEAPTFPPYPLYAHAQLYPQIGHFHSPAMIAAQNMQQSQQTLSMMPMSTLPLHSPIPYNFINANTNQN